jgi:hypothetical protein
MFLSGVSCNKSRGERPAKTNSALVQTVKQVDPIQSGIYTLPLVLSLVVSSILSGGITQRIGYYVPSMLVAPSIMSIGEGLLTTLNHESPTSHWVAFQFLSGFGLGFGMQTSGLAIQTVLPKEDVPTGIAINFFVQQLGGAVFTSVGQAILTNKLVSRLSGLPGFDPHLIVNEGATKLAEIVPPQDVGVVIGAYNEACRDIFFASMGLAFASLFCATGMEWKSIKKNKHKPPPRQEPAQPLDLLDSSSTRSNNPDNPPGPQPGKPFFEGAVSSRKGQSSRGSIFRPKSRDELKDKGQSSKAEGSGARKQGVLTKSAPERSKSGKNGSNRPDSSARKSQAGSDDKKDKDDLLAGALKDWARYSKAQEAKKEKPGLGDV